MKEIEIKDSILEEMHRYAWPGNVRELENTLQSFFVLGDEKSFVAKLRNQHFAANQISAQCLSRWHRLLLNIPINQYQECP